MALFESYDRRINQINTVLNNYGIKDIEEAKPSVMPKGSTPTKCVKIFNPSHSKMQLGLM